MKYFAAIALIVAVASANVLRPAQLSAEIEQIMAAINSPSTDPATAVALEAMLLEVLGLSPISVGPAIVETNPELSPISVGPAFIDFPIHDGGALTVQDEAPLAPVAVVEPAVVEPSPVVVGEVPAGSSPLVQIIVNVNQAESAAPAPGPVVIPAPVVVPEVVEEVHVPGPVNIVDGADITPQLPIQVVNPVIPHPIQVVTPVLPEPIQVVNPVIPEPIQVVNPVIPEPVQVVEPQVPEPIQVVEPVIIEPVIVGTPIIPAPAVVLPEELN